MVSEIFDPSRWKEVEGFNFTDITYHRAVDQGTVRIAFNRPEVRNAFRPHTVDELFHALDHARQWSDVGVVLLTTLTHVPAACFRSLPRVGCCRSCVPGAMPRT